MKKHHNQENPTRSANRNPSRTDLDNSFNRIDRVAEELTRLARERLPNGKLQGDLKGFEDDIRQAAILLALTWYLRSIGRGAGGGSGPAWIPARAIAAALRIAERDQLKEQRRRAKTLQEIRLTGKDVVLHPSMIPSKDWPTSTMKRLVSQAIRIAHQSGKISAKNAVIGHEIFVEEIPVKTLAGRLGVHRSAVAQQRGRVRRQIPEIIRRLEIALEDAQ